MCQEEKEDEDSPAMKIAWMHQLLGLKDYKKEQKRLITVASNSTDKIRTNRIATITKKQRRCPWCNCYRRRKWTRRHEFKSWTRLIAFPIGKRMNPIILPPAMGK